MIVIFWGLLFSKNSSVDGDGMGKGPFPAKRLAGMYQGGIVRGRWEQPMTLDCSDWRKGHTSIVRKVFRGRWGPNLQGLECQWSQLTTLLEIA